MSFLTVLTSAFHDCVFLLSVAVGLSVLYLLQLWFKYRNFPPGPWGVPLLGYGPFLAKDTLDTFKKLKDKYGDVYSINFGARMVVMLNNFDVMKDVYIRQGDKPIGYLQGFSIGSYFMGEGKNLFISTGELWKEQKRFLASNLRDFGLGKMEMEKHVQIEVEHLLHLLRDLDGQPCDVLKSRMLARLTCNVISVLVFGTRMDYGDVRLNRIIHEIDEFFSSYSQTSGVEVFPILRFLPDRISGLGPTRRCKKSIYSLIADIVNEHEETFDPENLRDMVDVYLKAIKETVKVKGKEVPPYTMDHLLGNISMLFMAGTDDPASILAWTFMLAALNPDSQKKIQQELDKTVGRNRLPSYKDKSNLVYFEAFYLEAQRVGAPFPMSMVHSTTDDMTISGYHIPAKTHIMSYFWLVLTDPKIWGDPEKFRPERFIDDDGKINRKRDYITTFGMGKRTCIGEPLAKMEIFLLITSVLQNFDLRLPPGSQASTYANQPDMRRLESCTVIALPRD